jgi:hypothetical protein
VSLPIIFAEVLDKEPDLGEIWMAWGSVAVLGFISCRRSAWCAILFLPLSILMWLWAIEDLWDPWVGPAIWQESPSLFVLWHVAMVSSVLGPLFGTWQALRERRKRRRARVF